MVKHLTTDQRGLFFVILVFAALSRFLSLGWDEGLMLHPDERNLVNAAVRLRFPDKLVPDFHAYNGLAVYLPRILAELIFTRDPPSQAEIALAARGVSATFSLVFVPVLFAVARRMFCNVTGLWTALIAACAPGLIQAAHFGTTESALALATGLSMLVAAYRSDGKLGILPSALAYGGIIGVGLGFKSTAASLALFPIVDCLLRARKGNILKSLFGLALTGLISLLLLLATTPQILFDTANYFATMVFEGNVVSGKADVFWTFQFHERISGLFELSQVPWMIGGIPAVFLVPGAWLFANSFKSRKKGDVAAWATGLFMLIYMSIIFSWHAKFIRYLMPVIPILILLSAHAIQKFESNVRMAWKKTLVLFAVMAIAGVGIDQFAIYGRQDPRIAAWEWLVPQLNPKEVLVLEPVETGPPFAGAEHLNLKIAHLPLIEKSGIEKINAMAKQLSDGNWLLISSRRHSTVLPRMRERFPEMCNYYAALWAGELGYDMVAKFHRRSGFAEWFDPGNHAEETFSVFDSPTVFVLMNAKQRTAPELAVQLGKPNPKCEPR